MCADDDLEEQDGPEKYEVSEVESIEWPQPPGIFAGNLYKRGIEYFEAFEHLSAHMPDHKFSAYFMLIHSIELFLKAYLIAGGFRKDQLWKKPLGHNLPGILEECEKQKLPHNYKFSLLVAQLHTMNSDYDFRYPTIYKISVPRPLECTEITREVLQSIHPLVERVSIEATLQFASDTRHLRPKKIRWKE